MLKIKLKNHIKTIFKNRYFKTAGIIIFFLILIFTGLYLNFKDRIFPGVKVLYFDLGSKKTNEIPEFLSQKITLPDKIELISENRIFELSLNEVSLNYDHQNTAIMAYKVYRNKSFISNLISQITSPFRKESVDLVYSYDQTKLDEYLEIVAEEVLSKPIYPSVGIENGAISVNKGFAGEILDKNTFLDLFNRNLLRAEFSGITLPLKKTDPSLTDEEVNLFKQRSEKFLGKNFYLINEYTTYNFDDSVIFSFLDYREQFNLQKIQEFINEEILPKVERKPQNAVLRFENNKVVEFVPAKDGLAIEENVLAEKIIDNLMLLENSDNKTFSLNIPVARSSPEITLNEINNLGIKELLGRGSSKFKGSISGRIHNISLASSKFNGVLVTPNEIFSFNNTLGDVSTFTGYKQAYIIKDGRTVLGDGGGVCQVSTTLFRAVLNAGLPINERRSHSYRVSYYEQDSPPGLDATVFSPSTDFKFANNTPGHLLIQTEFNPENYSLIFEIYGTSDGRISSISKPVITSSTPPPEDLFIDDPNLLTGTIKQIDYKAWGAKVFFDYMVERNGETIINNTFTSNYRPWQAVFLKGTKPLN